MFNWVLIFIFLLWKFEFIILSNFALFVLLILTLSSLTYDLFKFLNKFFNNSEEDDNGDDIFFDNAPNPVVPPSLPPSSEQIEFSEFMKNLQNEQEKEKLLVMRKNE